jgi:hypothetical protein
MRGTGLKALHCTEQPSLFNGIAVAAPLQCRTTSSLSLSLTLVPLPVAGDGVLYHALQRRAHEPRRDRGRVHMRGNARAATVRPARVRVRAALHALPGGTHALSLSRPQPPTRLSCLDHTHSPPRYAALRMLFQVWL